MTNHRFDNGKAGIAISCRAGWPAAGLPAEMITAMRAVMSVA
jgi:hypothetical protein